MKKNMAYRNVNFTGSLLKYMELMSLQMVGGTAIFD